MYLYDSRDRNIPTDTDAYYDVIASQEETYLEETEEDLRMILESDDPHPLPNESFNQQQERALEELITAIPMILHSVKRQFCKYLDRLEFLDVRAKIIRLVQ